MSANKDMACVRLGNEQVMVKFIGGKVVAKYAMRIVENGTPRKLTRDEELAYAAAPGTSAEREEACKRVGLIGEDEEIKLSLLPQPWLPGEEAKALAQIQRGIADTNKLA